jgi:hypothetical protein
MICHVVYIRFSLPSFYWGSGLYAIIEKDGNHLKLCRINEFGQPELYEDGRPMITGTSIDEEYKKITKTKLFIEL